MEGDPVVQLEAVADRARALAILRESVGQQEAELIAAARQANDAGASIAAIARAAQVSRPTVYTWIRQEDVPALV